MHAYTLACLRHPPTHNNATCTHTHIHTYAHIYIYIHLHAHTRFSLYQNPPKPTYTHTYIQSYIHIHTFTYISTHTFQLVPTPAKASRWLRRTRPYSAGKGRPSTSPKSTIRPSRVQTQHPQWSGTRIARYGNARARQSCCVCAKCRSTYRESSERCFWLTAYCGGGWC